MYEHKHTHNIKYTCIQRTILRIYRCMQKCIFKCTDICKSAFTNVYISQLWRFPSENHLIFAEYAYDNLHWDCNATPPRVTKSRNLNSSVHIQIKPKSQCEFVPRNTEQCKFDNLADFWGVAMSVENVIYIHVKKCSCIYIHSF